MPKGDNNFGTVRTSQLTDPKRKNVISKTKIENPFSIQPVETFGQSALQLHLYKREILDQKNTDKTTKQAPGLNDGVWLNDNTPLQSRAQYPTKNATAYAALIQETVNTESNDEDD